MASFAYLQGNVVPPREKGRMQAKTSKVSEQERVCARRRQWRLRGHCF